MTVPDTVPVTVTPPRESYTVASPIKPKGTPQSVYSRTQRSVV
jgi:hypothetical protein